MNERGIELWRGKFSVWGELLGQEAINDTDYDNGKPECNLRFQGQWYDPESGLHYNRYRYYDPQTAQYLSPDPIGLAGGLTPQAYVHDTNAWVDPLGLNTITVNPNDINFSQRTVSEIRTFDSSKYSPINVMEVDGQLVSYDNRRLLSAQNAGLTELEVNIVKADDAFPGSTTGKTWGQKFQERFNDKRNKKAGGVVPDKGLKEKPTLPCNQTRRN